MILAPFEKAHAQELLAEGINDERARPTFGVDVLGDFSQPDMAYTFIDRGHLIAISGVQPLYPGVGEAWLIGSDRLSAHRVSVSRTCRRWMRKIANEEGLHRVQAHMKTEWAELSRWAQFLGMEREGTIKQMTPDREDYDLWAWINNGR